ncbi:MAG: SMC family ATPase [Thermostichales cyanobacterium BF3_bins_165]
MIPIRLGLENFFSYQQGRIDLSAIHTACIFGANGAGKSALLEALTWGIWGQCRCSREEDVIRRGAMLAQVELIYESQQEQFRVVRRRHLREGGALEWQVRTPQGWRSLTRKTMRATQLGIEEQLGLDYETFVNSVYLRQGRADEFVLKRPGERKRILSEILRLERYQPLAEQSRELGRRVRLRLEWVGGQVQQLQDLERQLAECRREGEGLQQRLERLRWEQQQDEEHLQTLRQQQQQQHYLHKLQTSLVESEQQWRQQQHYLEHLRGLIHRRQEIVRGYQRYGQVLELEQGWQERFLQQEQWRQALGRVEAEMRPWQERYQRQEQELQQQMAVIQAQIEEDQRCLQEWEQVEGAYQTYRQAWQRLQELQRLQQRARPLMQRLQERRLAVQEQRAQWLARQRLLERQLQQPLAAELWGQTQQLATAIADLERQRVYYQRLQEKIQARRGLVQQLQERQRSLQRQCQWLEREQGLLSRSDDQGCPLCEQPLTEELRTRLLAKQQRRYSELEEDLLVIREQLAVADREIALFESEARPLAAALGQLEHHRQAQGRLEAQLEAQRRLEEQRQQWQAELESLRAALSRDPREEWGDLEEELAALGYSEADHALWRAEVDRWRWAAGRWHDLQRRRQRQQELHQRLAVLEGQRQALGQGEPQWLALLGQRQEIVGALAALAYDAEQHQRVREELRQCQVWAEQYQALQQAEGQLPHVEQLCQEYHRRWLQYHQEYRQLQQQLPPEPIQPEQIQALESRIRERRQEIDQVLARLGASQQQQLMLQQEAARLRALEQEQQCLRRQQQVYQELSYAFGPNGIPSLIIENVLPELEAHANQILSRLTQHQLHLHFATQRSSKRASKAIDTLDILIADTQGTRPYETYSGGEAFRINFAIRLALSTLLMRRSGSRLQTLMIDEGFGSQDPQGRQALVGAINAIAADFARILVITHIPSLRDAFPQRLNVYMTPQGSQVEVMA